MNTTRSTHDWVSQIIAPRTSGTQHMTPVALEAAMQSLALDEHHPIALEIAGSASKKQWLFRSTSKPGHDHVATQLRARYPQADIVPLAPQDDPLRLQETETLSVVELRAGSAAYLPLRTWQERERAEEGADPLLGVLAALEGIADGMRVVAQIAMVPAPATWSRKSQRRAVEHPLEPERARERLSVTYARSQEGAPGNGSLLGLGLVLLVLFLLSRFPHAVPPWLSDAALELLHGQTPMLTQAHLFLVLLWGGGALLSMLLVMVVLARLQRLVARTAIYDQRLVAQKTMRMAYRVRIRLYVITPRVLPRSGRCSMRGVWNDSHRVSTRYVRRVAQVWATTSSRARWEARLLHVLVWHVHTSLGVVMKTLTHAWQLSQQRHNASEQRQEYLLRLIAAYRQFHLASGDYFVARHLAAGSARRLLVTPAGLFPLPSGWWRGVRRSTHYVGVDTLSMLWHLLHGSALGNSSLLEQRRTRSFPLPPSLLAHATGQNVVGYAEHAGTRLPFALPPDCLHVHTLIGGKSGEGKSTSMEHLAREVMVSGSGLLLIDPHGDLSERVLRLVPPERADEVVLIDLADPTYSVGINPLDVTLGRGRDKAVADLLHTLSHVWAKSWGPRMENAFEMALRTLYEANRALVARDLHNGPAQQYTLLDVLPLLTDESVLHALLQQIHDPFLDRWWFTYYEPLSLTQQRDIINPVISKTTKFESVIARRIIGQSCSTINFSQLVEQRKIVLVKLAKGESGSDVAPLLGATILGLVQLSLEEQGRSEVEQRTPLPIIIDEFQALEGTDYGALAELRKYGATFFLATQSFAYLKVFQPALLSTVLANVQHFFIYHMSAEDARLIHEELGVEEEDITMLERHTCYVRLTSQGRRQPVFSLSFVLPPPGDAAQAQQIRVQSQMRYGRPVTEVDEAVRDALRRTLALSLAMEPQQQGTTASNGVMSLPAPVPLAQKKRKGEWVKGGRKHPQQQPSPRLTPSAFANAITEHGHADDEEAPDTEREDAEQTRPNEEQQEEHDHAI